MNVRKTVDAQLVDSLWQTTSAIFESRAGFPESTYRLQFHAGFTFRDATRIAPYLAALGVTHCYASPYLKARPGSTHGYDIIDHASLNPEIGSAEDYDAWTSALAEHGLRQILDIVPNHMGVATNDNAWWNDILENGPGSRFAEYFDIAWRASPRVELQDKVLLPVLGQPYGDALEGGQISATYSDGAFSIVYFERRFPLDPRTYGAILGHRLEELQKSLGAESPALQEYESILTASRNLPERTLTEPDKIGERAREKEIIKRRLAALVASSPEIEQFLTQNLALFNGQPGNARSFDLLHALLEQQGFRMAYWRVALDEINYRRFFDINDLAALSMEREDVFAAAHAFVLRLAAEGKIAGFRIDHPDGLFDPAQYFQRLQEGFVLACARRIAEQDVEAAAIDWAELEPAFRKRFANVDPKNEAARRPLYVVIEKILSPGESLAEGWSIHGASGYDFLNIVNGLFVDGASESAFSRLYHDFIGDDTTFAEYAYRKKLLILQVSMASELHMLTHQLDRLAQKNRGSRDITFNTLRRALREVIACFPTYRSYIAAGDILDDDRRNIQMAVRRATLRSPLISRRVFQFIADMLLANSPPGYSDADRAEARLFARKFQQVTGPVTAKGIEDTAFYVYHRLASLNDVGGEPTRFGVAPEAVHAYFRERQAKWPWSLSVLSTHDTKRSEDVRARLNVLSEMPDPWNDRVKLWARFNTPHRKQVDDAPAPSANDEYLLYQTLIGAWPLGAPNADEWTQFVQRIQAYMEKAIHEAKVNTSWINPNADYDAAVKDFVACILDEQKSGPFLGDFRIFQRRVSELGMINSLAQTLLRIAGPGVPDTYQGTEFWDFSLVDPDNRRPVDYVWRQQTLLELQAGPHDREFARTLVAKKDDGRVKMFVTFKALTCRRDHPGLFSAGEYLPLATTGAKAAHLFAFARHRETGWTIVAVPRLVAGLMPHGFAEWGDTQLSLEGLPPELVWRDVFTSAEWRGNDAAAIPVADLLMDFPVALLLGKSSH